jgi:hypothetical protein
MVAPIAPDALSDPRQNAMPAMIELSARQNRRDIAGRYCTAARPITPVLALLPKVVSAQRRAGRPNLPDR